jgi:DNA-directed RNA polymerase specialized sigma24 family protein
MDCSMCPDRDIPARQDPQQLEALIETYAPQVKYLAQRLACRLPASIDLDDLISAGVLGLLDAIQKYDPTQAASLKQIFPEDFGERQIISERYLNSCPIM